MILSLFTENVDCSCGHHSSTNDAQVPWLPRVAPIVSNGNVPNLLPLGSALRANQPSSSESGLRANRSSSSTTLTGLDAELLEAQIKINAKVMKEIDALKQEQKAVLEEKNKLMALNEQLVKEKMVAGVKLAQTSEQLQYLKKKMDKHDSNADSKENQSPKQKDPEAN